MIFALPSAAIDGTGDFQFIDYPNHEKIVLDVVQIDRGATKRTNIDMLGIFVVETIAKVLQTGLAEGVTGYREKYPQKSRRGL